MPAASGALRDAFTKAVKWLPTEQVALFERETGSSLPWLAEQVAALPHATLSHVLDMASSEKGNAFSHPLNAHGLHVLKWLLARRIIDERRAANGWASHPEYDLFNNNGLLMRRLHHWRPGATRVPLTVDEADLISLASGWSRSPYGCKGVASHGVPGNSSSGISVSGVHDHVFQDADDQYQLHVDVFMPNIKFMIFMEPVVVERGPFHFVLGSHKPSAAKARWLFERSRHLTGHGRAGGAFRHVNLSAPASAPDGWCYNSRSCLEAAYDRQQRDLTNGYGFPRPMPLLVEAGTLVVADTSAFHFRGLGVAGKRRARMGNVANGCKRGGGRLGFLVQVPRLPVLGCAAGSNVSHACSTLYPR